jgi:hypothetical protein
VTPEEARDKEFRRWMEAGHCPRCGREEPLTVRSATNDTDPTSDPPFMICARCGQEEWTEEAEWQTRGFWPAHFVRIKGT